MRSGLDGSIDSLYARIFSLLCVRSGLVPVPVDIGKRDPVDQHDHGRPSAQRQADPREEQEEDQDHHSDLGHDRSIAPVLHYLRPAGYPRQI